MRKNHNTKSTFVDTGLLRDHVSKLREEKKVALRLRESITAMRNSSDQTAFESYRSVLQDVNQLIEYLDRMARQLNEAEERAVQISHETGSEIEENDRLTRHTSSSAFML